MRTTSLSIHDSMACLVLVAALLAACAPIPPRTGIPDTARATALDGEWRIVSDRVNFKRFAWSKRPAEKLVIDRGYGFGPDGRAWLRFVPGSSSRIPCQYWDRTDDRWEKDCEIVIRRGRTLEIHRTAWSGYFPTHVESRARLVELDHPEQYAARFERAWGGGSPETGESRQEALLTANEPVDRDGVEADRSTRSVEYHALVIGNQDYLSLPGLGTPIADSLAIARTLHRQYGFEVEVLNDATRAQIVSRVAQYREQLSSEDRLLIYYAGHGWYDEEARQGYWLPVDASAQDPANWISNATLVELVRANPARHILIMADSCFSGALTRGIRVPRPSSAYVERLSSKRARTVMTSGGLEPVEDDGGSGHSAFALAFLDVLHQNEAVIDGHGVFASLRRLVMLNANQTPEYGDIRFAGHDGGDFLFVRKN